MPANSRTPWLICYDIADPARLREVHKEVRRHALPFQYSVFRAHATRREVVARFRVLEGIIDPRHDDIRAYPLLSGAVPVVYGRRLLAAGVHMGWRGALFDNPLHESSDSEADAATLASAAHGTSQVFENTFVIAPGPSERAP